MLVFVLLFVIVVVDIVRGSGGGDVGVAVEGEYMLSAMLVLSVLSLGVLEHVVVAGACCRWLLC